MSIESHSKEVPVSQNFGSGENSTIEDEPSLGETLFAGVFAGVSGDWMCHGIDTVKTRLQAPNSPYRHAPHAFTSILQHEGLSGLYGGGTAAAAGALVSSMVYFTFYESFKHCMTHSTNVPAPVIHFIGGGLGDLFASCIYNPFEVIKTRMQAQAISSSHHRYVSFRDAAISIGRQEGLRGYYRGYLATIYREVPFTACLFPVYEQIKTMFLHARAQRVHSRAECLQDGAVWDGNLTAFEGFATGLISGSVAGLVTTPCDVVKTRLQLSGGTEGIWHTLVQIVRTEGVRKLFSGVGARIMWTGPQSAWMLFAYEKALDIAANYNLARERLAHTPAPTSTPLPLPASVVSVDAFKTADAAIVL